MLKAFRKMKGKPVKVDFRDETDMGGGIESRDPGLALLFLDAGCCWVSFKWEWSGQLVIVPVSDIACISSDI